MTGWKGQSNESVDERCANGVTCEAVGKKKPTEIEGTHEPPFFVSLKNHNKNTFIIFLKKKKKKLKL